MKHDVANDPGLGPLDYGAIVGYLAAALAIASRASKKQAHTKVLFLFDQ